MRKKQLIESILSEELKRFNQIGDYVNEQFMGLSSQNVSLMEQEPTEDEEEGGGDSQSFFVFVTSCCPGDIS